eukprot:CAMPEP_0117829412 /NCGR_PEP_ID=MMETSP0949-20121206/7850_1 /TAXON_ID=44440 /ORGANISM="Chattonella subsalsa, Strain CCMP2191" /LENGTH=219 /DNA_ID=CAMNT_0005670157 /DNA_START=188 /DNA_END=848 /DNA_ORIENTATION=+
MRHSASGRPSLDDVERISKGQAAKKRGTGSRAVPHRLNAAERKEWDLAKKRGYLQLRGTGYRRERGDSPLANIYRQWCDAKIKPCIVIERGIGIDALDKVIVDVSTQRETKTCATIEKLKECAERYDCTVTTVPPTDPASESALEELPIWQLPPDYIIFEPEDRSEAKKLAEAISTFHTKTGGAVMIIETLLLHPKTYWISQEATKYRNVYNCASYAVY